MKVKEKIKLIGFILFWVVIIILVSYIIGESLDVFHEM